MRRKVIREDLWKMQLIGTCKKDTGGTTTTVEYRKGGHIRRKGKIINCCIEDCFELKGQLGNTRGSTGSWFEAHAWAGGVVRWRIFLPSTCEILSSTPEHYKSK